MPTTFWAVSPGPTSADQPEPRTQPGRRLALSSVKSMLSHQVESGAFFASMDFAPYRYCWLRDGSFTAFALDRAGEQEAAERFHRWAAAAVGGIAPTVRAATERRLAGGTNDAASMPPARYTVEGTVERDSWPNFQIDGYGTWLWAVSEHVEHWGAKTLVDELGESLELACSYLEAVDLDPCYDCWEENGQAVHTSTLACVYGGLSASAALLGRRGGEAKGGRGRPTTSTPGCVAARGSPSRAPTAASTPASSGWPYPSASSARASTIMAATAAEVQESLELDGGIRRYGADTYYGGGAWPLLTAWLGWYRASTGDLSRRATVGRVGRAPLRRRRPPPRAGRRRASRPRVVPQLGRAHGAARPPT